MGVRIVYKEGERCKKCGKLLSIYNPFPICYSCLEKTDINLDSIKKREFHKITTENHDPFFLYSYRTRKVFGKKGKKIVPGVDFE